MTSINSSQTVTSVFNTLKFTYAIVAIVAGLDKFTNILTQWENYLHSGIANLVPFTPHSFMMIVGVIEIIAGILVLARPRMGGYVVASWLTMIALTLIAGGNYLDVAVRDLAMAVGALSMARLWKV